MPAKKDIDLNKFKKLLNEGISTDELCKIFNTTKSSIARAKLKCGYLTKKFKNLTEKIPYKDFYDLFVNKRMSTYEIAKFYNETRNAIVELMELYDIGHKSRKLNLSYEELYQDYKIEKMSYEKLAKKYNVSTHEITRLIKKYGFKHNSFEGIIEKDKLYNLYIVQNLRAKDVAELFGCSLAKLNEYLYKYNIKKDPKQYHELAKETCLKKYGIENGGGSKEAQLKIEKTKKLRGTFGKSKEEDKIFDLLKEKFGDVNRQYHSDLYQFPCDFYIPKLDLYIEYQGYWTHGREAHTIYGPFDENNKIHRETLRKWKQKAKEGYKSYDVAICVWTVSDPLKRETAKKNNLNWLEFWTLEEFMKWYEKQ